MSTAFTPEQISQALKLAKKYDEYDRLRPSPRGDYHVENRRALVYIIEHLQGELTVERTHNGTLSEANDWYSEQLAQSRIDMASVEFERNEARELHAQVCERNGTLSTQLAEALREIERLKAALRNQNTSGVA